MLLRGLRRIGEYCNKTVIYLPYSGGDEETILRLFTHFVKLKYSGFVIDSSNLKIIQELIRVAVGNDNKKGLVVRGTVGVGKTTLVLIWIDFRVKVMDALYQRARVQSGDLENRVKVLIHDRQSLISEFTLKGYAFFADEYKTPKLRKVMFVDDLGLPTSINYFGTNINITEELIYSRYAEFKKYPDFEFYATTNLTSKELAETIGERAMSRLLEMAEWNAGFVDGEDKRKKTNNLKMWPNL